jgi:hypothetical protein
VIFIWPDLPAGQRIIRPGKSARQSLDVRRKLRRREESPGSIGQDAS